EFEISASGGHCLEFNTPGTSKGQALTTLLDLLNIQPEEAMVFGDNNNDLSDFQLPGVFKVAMGNAIDEIKAAADYVTA
ncbi:HAD hydrolase family protein, partial [Escherichia coli]